jgi:hypothetical protein
MFQSARQAFPTNGDLADGFSTMPCEIRWKSSFSAACLHVAACWRAGFTAADAQLSEALDHPASVLVGELSRNPWAAGDVLGQLASLSAEIENNRELVTRALARLRLTANDAAITRVAGAIADLEAAMRRQSPELADELILRAGPICQQWEARGPGLLVDLARLTDAAVVPEFAEVVLVSPYTGGHGLAHPLQNRVTLEAMLVNPVAEIPETVRLGWLIGQLNSDLPHIADALPAGRSAAAMRMAMLAPALAAGEAVELTRCDEAMLEIALDAWRLRDGLPADAGRQLWSWWETWLESRENWPIAVAALDGML